MHTALTIAAVKHRTEVIDLLLTAQADPDQATHAGGLLPLCAACDAGHLDVAQALVTASAVVDHSCVTKATALYVAAKRGHVGIVEFLVGRTATGQIDFRNPAANDGTALHVAAKLANAEVMKLLIDAGAAVDPVDSVPPRILAAAVAVRPRLSSVTRSRPPRFCLHTSPPSWPACAACPDPALLVRQSH